MSDAVIDSCCLINLCAAGNLRELLSTLKLSWHVPDAVLREALFLRGVDEEGRVVKERVELEGIVKKGILGTCSVEPGDESELYVQLAAVVDDGEAMALAIAKSRGWLLATDDRLAIRCAEDMAVRIITTPELMKRWADAARKARHQIASALRRVQERARFVPGPRCPLYDWWADHLANDS